MQKKELNEAGIRVYGRVQGVGFRYWTAKIAKKFNIRGFVRNDGENVYIEAEGEKEKLESFLARCKKGPFLARVVNLEAKEGEVEEFREFVIDF